MFNRFDICEAYYVFASAHHSGQDSKEYEIFSRLEKIKFSPSINLSYESLTDDGQEIYNNLKVNYG
jgi:hypothetical protein